MARDATVSPSSPPGPGIRRRGVLKRAAMLMRRAHLFLGLFLIPWVLVYATTGFLFNHPTAWVSEPPAPAVRRFGPGAATGTGLDALPTARELAEQVAAALGRRGAGVRLVSPERAFFDWPTLSVETAGEGGTHTARIRMRDGSGVVSTQAGPVAVPAPFAVKEGLFGEPPLPRRVERAAPELFDRLGLGRGRVRVRSIPELTFFLEADGRLWRGKYDPVSGSLGGTPTDGADGLPPQQFLKDLHVSAGYPGHAEPRWWWALAVDGLAAAMTFWCVSGLFMWWQLKAVRAAGALVLLASVLAAATLGLAMYGVFDP